MGRYSFRDETDDYHQLSVRKLREWDYFSGWRSGTVTWTRGEHKSSIGIMVIISSDEKYIKLNYTQTTYSTGEKKDFDYKVPIVSTNCNYGGVRYWFVCPLYKNGKYCGKRCGVLYKGGDYFGCRECYNLIYSSQKMNTKYRYYPLFRVLDLDNKIDGLEKKIKRRFYAGRPTKLQRRLERLYEEASRNYALSQSQKLV